jgi:DNA-binding CsgD family transcriptional regulator
MKFDIPALIFESIPIAIFAINNEHTVTHWNIACEKLSGLPAKKVLGTKRPWLAFYDQKRPVMADLIVDKASEGLIARNYFDKFQRSTSIDGAYEGVDFFPKLGQSGKWLFFTAAPLKNREGKIFGSIETLQDITRQRKLEINLTEERAKLSEQARYLEQVNQALKSMLDQREVEKRATEENMLNNLKRFILPYVDQIRTCAIDSDAVTYLNVIETNLTQFLAQHQKALFLQYQSLTPTEVGVVNLIREGKTTKEIADMIHISPSSVQWHRKNIRTKLGLTHTKQNLQTYLLSLETH